MLNSLKLSQSLTWLSRRILPFQTFHGNSPNFDTPRNEESVTSYEDTVHVGWLVCMKRVIKKSLRCDMNHENACDGLHYLRVKYNGGFITRDDLDKSCIRVGDYFTVDGAVNVMTDGIFYKIRKAEVMEITKRDRSIDPTEVLRRGAKRRIKGMKEKWRFEVKMKITVTTKSYFRRVMYSDLPKKGSEAFKVMLDHCKPSDNVYGGKNMAEANYNASLNINN